MNVAHKLDTGTSEEAVLIFCPACGYGHCFYTKATGNRPVWQWNGSLEKPTFKPSMLVYGHKSSNPEFRSTPRCHSFVTDGMIQFLGDCEHKMAGQTVPLEPF